MPSCKLHSLRNYVLHGINWSFYLEEIILKSLFGNVCNMSFNKWLEKRERGCFLHQTDRDFITNRVYCSIQDYEGWNSGGGSNEISEFGAVFNLEFSPEGNVLVAACERKAIALFDAIGSKPIYKITDAHGDNVNCIKFLDDRMFATCSDDTTVALWDLRCLKMKVRSLHGHSNWVKNVEYSPKDKLLVTSGFDGSIYTWDLNSHTEQGLIYQKVFHTSGLMRCRIVPDGSKLVICSTGGYLMIIHDLDLTTLHKDLCGFRPSMYRLMQMGQQYIPQAAKFDHLFSKRQKTNRVELVTDFPEENDAEVILALQIHPHGHSILSRNISYDEKTEWSCIHDIYEDPDDVTKHTDESQFHRKRKLTHANNESLSNWLNVIDVNSGTEEGYNISRRQRHLRSRLSEPISQQSIPTSSSVPPSLNLGTNSLSMNIASPSNRPESFVPDIWAAEVTVQERAIRQSRARSSNSVTGYNYVYAISSGVLTPGITNNSTSATQRIHATSTSAVRATSSSFSDIAASTDASSTDSSDDLPSSFSCERIRAPLGSSVQGRIFQNPKKLMYYLMEPNKGRGFIKEPCFSSDGRIICSPYDNGIRLLSYTNVCSEHPSHDVLIKNIKSNPRPLVVLKEIKAHHNIVLSTKFSPREPLLVTGCRNGKIVWNRPKL